MSERLSTMSRACPCSTAARMLLNTAAPDSPVFLASDPAAAAEEIRRRRAEIDSSYFMF